TDGRAVARLNDNEIALNAWAAEDLNAKPGDTIRVTYFEPESTHGNVIEKTVELKLVEIVALTGAADDSHLTPTLPGVTDQLSISDWNPPFPFDSNRIRKRDEEYWDDHKATPKAFVSLETGRKLWGSRFGNTTSLRVPGGEGQTAEKLAALFKPDPPAMGFEFRPVKMLALQASAGTTPFEFLFLGFSIFIIVAALALVAILFRLGVDARAREVGLLMAIGWPMARIRRALLAEGLLVATAGAAIGVLLGIGYAWLMIVGLTTWWVAAITAPFLRLHVVPATLPIGALAGVVTSGLVIYRAVARLRKSSVRSLLAGQTEQPFNPARRPGMARWIAPGGLVLALLTGLSAVGLSGEAQAGAFFGSGFLVLVALLAMISTRLRAGSGGSLVTVGPGAIARLALRNAGRHPGRSTLTIGLIAAASFLIVAISAFRIDPNADATARDNGTGGFAIVAESAQPIYQDLNSDDGQFDLGLTPTDRKQMTGAHAIALRVAAGDDASCLNLYQAQQPRVLGIPREMIERGGFAWAGSSAKTPEEKANPWLLLECDLPPVDGQPVTPVAIDVATAKYALHLSAVGATYEITDGRGKPLRLQVVGLLAGSVLQGSLLMAEAPFLKNFPDTSGYRFFLIDAPAAESDTLSQTLEGALGDYGFDAESAPVRLAEYSAVQNTYLSTFQSLGGLGLLLGTIGLAAVQLRNVAERRGEIALLQAAGFRRALVARMVVWENAFLLVGGLAVGCLAALVALLPHLVGGAARLPWGSVALTLGLVLGVGLAAGMAAVAAAVRAPILATLRGE
ncbi:MAG TPA: FtsX-like permease family protein, partial [Pirellulales bacterium]